MHIFGFIIAIVEFIASILYIGSWLKTKEKIPKIEALSMGSARVPRVPTRDEDLERKIGHLKLDAIRRKCPELHISDSEYDMHPSKFRHLKDVEFDADLLGLRADQVLFEETTTEHVKVAIPKEKSESGAQWIEPGDELITSDVVNYHIVNIPARTVVRAIGKFHHV
ncbi:MAG: hypothetical protein KAS32_19110 [Candidatus Peribacteraceae bacterium]|nr:hypothetical protein [Candidatus Peribacteraceae bacterium]